MGTQPNTEAEFNQIHFEKRLTSLKDSQESINNCCQWCLENRAHHKKIVNCWLNVLKRVKVEQRLVLFYLANDVIQYSKRRRYEYVESWGTALQKATTMVRDDKVKHKILRIFKIWEQRAVYNEEFIADLCGLISVSPTAPKNDEPHEFQASHLVKKIRYCSSLEMDTDSKLKVLKEHNPKIQIEPDLCSSLKDRAHVDDVEKEMDVYVSHMEDYVNALKLEIKNRISLISVLKQAQTQLETDKKDVKVVANAYRTFAVRVKTFQKKLDEHKETLVSPIPSPDIDAPSPSPDSDIDLPDGELEQESTKNSDSYPEYPPSVQYTNAGYYNPVSAPATEANSNFVSNGYTSFIGGAMPFNVQNFDPSSLFSNSQNGSGSLANKTQTTSSNLGLGCISTIPTMVQAPTLSGDTTGSSGRISPLYQYRSDHIPLQPPPMPPFSSKNDDYARNNYSYTSAPSTNYGSTMSYEPSAPAYQTAENNYNSVFTTQSTNDFDINNYSTNSAYEAPPGANPYPPSSDEYNPEQDLDTWDPEQNWAPPLETDTPESPPMFEKEGYGDPIEYHDALSDDRGLEDIDQRVIPIIPIDTSSSSSSSNKSKGGRGHHDVDHRNLISLTGSPGDSNMGSDSRKEIWESQVDQDYRNPPTTSANLDQDYRLPPFNIEQLKLPPPPPPPPKTTLITPVPTITTITTTPIDMEPQTQQKSDDIVESIDMDLSDDENMMSECQKTDTTNLKVVVDNVEDTLNEPFDENQTSQDSFMINQLVLEPPPPFPDLPDDEDANNFLDGLESDLNSSEFTTNLADDFPDIPDDEFMKDDLFENMTPMQFSNLQNIPLNPPPNLPDLPLDSPSNMGLGPPNMGLAPPNMPGNAQGMTGNIPNMLGDSSMMPMNMPANQMPGSLLPPPPMMSMPPLDWPPPSDQPMNPSMSGPPNFPFRGRSFNNNRGNGNFRGGNFGNNRGNFNGQPQPNYMNNQMNFNNNNWGGFQNNRGNNNRGNWTPRGGGYRGRGNGFRGGRGRGGFRGNFRGGF